MTKPMTTSADMPRDIVELLRASDVPLTAKQVAQKALGFSSSNNIERLEAVLEELKGCGKAFEFPPERTGYGPRFGHVSPAEWLAERIVSSVREAGGRLTLRQVRGSLRKWEAPYFDEALGKLVRDARLFYLTARYKYVLSHLPDPYDYLLPRQVTALREVLERINRHRKHALSVEELQAFLNGAGETETSPQHAGRLSEELLREWYHKDLPKRGGLSSIPIPWTWNHYESWCRSNKVTPDLVQFQEFIWSLNRVGKVEFIPHSLTQNIPEREAEIALRGPHGEVFYYWKWR
jgi:hypothetical protein